MCFLCSFAVFKLQVRGLREADCMTVSKLELQETRPKFLFPKIGQVWERKFL